MGTSFSKAMVFLLAAFGLNLAPQEFWSGLFLALAGAYIAMIWSPESSIKELHLILATAVILAIVSVLAAQHFFPTFPPQLAMALSGLVGRWLIARQNKLMDRLVNKVLPEYPEKPKTPKENDEEPNG